MEARWSYPLYARKEICHSSVLGGLEQSMEKAQNIQICGGQFLKVSNFLNKGFELEFEIIKRQMTK